MKGTKMKYKIYEQQFCDVEKIVCFTIEANSQEEAEKLWRENYPYEIAENVEETILNEDCYDCNLQKIERS